jgi:hypothetical protein
MSDSTIENSIDDWGYWIIDKSKEKPFVKMRVWAMPDGLRNYDIYKLDSNQDNPMLFDGINGGYFKIRSKVPENEVDNIMNSELKKDLKKYNN